LYKYRSDKKEEKEKGALYGAETGYVNILVRALAVIIFVGI